MTVGELLHALKGVSESRVIFITDFEAGLVDLKNVRVTTVDVAVNATERVLGETGTDYSYRPDVRQLFAVILE